MGFGVSGMPGPANSPAECAQRAALIRTLAFKPSLLLLDEPFSALGLSDAPVCMRRRNRYPPGPGRKRPSWSLTISRKPSAWQTGSSSCRKDLPGSAGSCPLPFEQPELSPFERRSAPEFRDYFNLLWKELNDHMKRHENLPDSQSAYLKKLARRQLRIRILRILIFVLFLVLWETAARLGWIDDFIFSSPSPHCRNLSLYVGRQKHPSPHRRHPFGNPGKLWNRGNCRHRLSRPALVQERALRNFWSPIWWF